MLKQWRLVAALVLGWAIIGTDWLPPPVTTYGQVIRAQNYSYPPVLNPSNAAVSTPLTVPYNPGTVTLGGFQINIPAGSVVLADNQNACGAPQFAACNIVYWSASAPTVMSVTQSYLTAAAPGNSVVWFISTQGGAVTSMVGNNLTYDNSTGTGSPGLVPLQPLCNAVQTLRCSAPRAGSLSGF